MFALLAPDGKKRLTRTGRGPSFAFRDSEDLAAGMRRIAAKYRGKAVRAVPYLADLRRGLNVASCDIQPLVIVADRKLESEVAKRAWSRGFIGAFAYARVTNLEELSAIDATAAGVYVVQPGAFGVTGKVLAKATNAAELEAALTKGLKSFVAKEKDSRNHIRDGRRTGVHWKTEIPVTDPGGRRR